MAATPPFVYLLAQSPSPLPQDGALATPGYCDRVLVSRGLDSVAAAEWDRLLEIDDAPLLSWAYLEGLERAGCVGGTTSWQPAHLLVRRVFGRGPARKADFDPTEGELVAAAPAYIKYDSEGEWVVDFDWADFAASRGITYYPKLVLAVPFNPVGGGRLLTQPELEAGERERLRLLLLQSAKRLCHLGRMSSVHILFPRPSAVEEMGQAGFLLRQQEQYHFLNRGYRDFEDFLALLRGHRRNTIRRERRALSEAGITVRTYRGLGDGKAAGRSAPGFSREQLDEMFDLYMGTSLRYTGLPPYLNRGFFHLCAERLGQRLELVLAWKREGGGESLVGGAWNLRGDRRLFGRYWGQREPAAGERPIPFLHFEVCYYHSVERCIEERLEAFEPGHGGEHKLMRGFTPVLTGSAHYIREARLRRPLTAFLVYEAPLVRQAQQAAAARCPLPAGGESADIAVEVSTRTEKNE